MQGRAWGSAVASDTCAEEESNGCSIVHTSCLKVPPATSARCNYFSVP